MRAAAAAEEILLRGSTFLFPRAMSQADAKHPFDECREGQKPRSLAAQQI